MRRAALALFMTVAIAACSTGEGGVRSQWNCGTAGPVTILWTDDWVEVTHMGTVNRLPRAISGSGARYADDDEEIWEHQGRIVWTESGVSRRICDPWD